MRAKKGPFTPGGLPRVLEGLFALVALAVSLPILVVVAIVVASTSRGGALFRQTRVGRHGRPFEMVKFRSMRAGALPGGEVTVGTDPRITFVGRWLRRWKLDELPELWHVVIGDMSLVGPRPEVPGYVDLEDPRWTRALSVRPGLTDPTTLRLRCEEQLLAAAAEDVDEFYRRYLIPFKLAGYCAYLERRTWASDLIVLGQTVVAVIAPRSIAAANIEELMGGNRTR